MSYQQELLALALEYAERGIPVFLLDLNTKAPVESGMGGFKGATTDPVEIEARINRARITKDIGIGLYPGGGGYVVLDIDDKNGKNGTEALEQLVGGDVHALPVTGATYTPSGGRHLWYKKDDFVGNADLCEGVNIRADSGYVVAPGQTRADGKGWKWDSGRGFECIVPWSSWLRDRLAGQGKQTGSSRWQELDWSKISEDGREMVERLIEVGAGHKPTIQNGSVYLVAPHKQNGVGISVDFIGPGIAKVWDDSIVLPDGKQLPHEEVFNLGELEYFLQTGKHPNTIKVKQGPEIVKKRVVGKGRFRAALMDLDAIEEMQPPEFMIDGWLPRGALCQLYAGSGVGKTFLAIDWMMHIASGTDWQGFKVKKSDKVMYVIAEGASGFGKRTAAWRQEHQGLRFEDVTLLPLAVNLASGEEMEELLEIVEERKPQLVVIDTLARSSVGSDENSNKDMSVVVNNATQIQEASPGATILILHHTGHTNTDRARGASSLYAALDASFRLDGSTRAGLTLVNDKQKEAEQAHPLRLNVRKVDLVGRYDSLGNLLNSLVIDSGEDLEGEEVRDEGPSIPRQALQVADVLWRMPLHKAQNKDWMAKTGMANGMFSKWKRIAEENGLVRKSGDGKNDPWEAVCDPYGTNPIKVNVSYREAQA